MPRRCAACQTARPHAPCADERLALLPRNRACRTRSGRSTCAAVLLEPLESPPLRPPRADPLLRFSLEQVVTPSFIKPCQRPRAPRALYPDDKTSRGWHKFSANEITKASTLISTVLIVRPRAQSRGARRARTLHKPPPKPQNPPSAPEQAPWCPRTLSQFARIQRVPAEPRLGGAARAVRSPSEPSRALCPSPDRTTRYSVRRDRVRGRWRERYRCMCDACACGTRGSEALYVE